MFYINNGLIYRCENYASIICNNNTGAIVYCNEKTGIIRECYNNGKSMTGNLALAGISYNNLGTITKTVNNSYVGVSNGVGQVAGISILNDGIVEYCINNGRIEGWQDGGGIICTNTGRLSNSYNTGSTNVTWYSAGICRNNKGNINNCYNLGTIGIAGWPYALSDKDITNSYSLEIPGNLAGSNYTNCSFRTEAELKSDEQITLLNTGNTEEVWVKDIKGINKGFPILAWQLEN